jgi:hypothetical protein
MNEHDEGVDPEVEQDLDAAVQEHLPHELQVQWTIEAMHEMGIDPAKLPENHEDIPEEASFRAQQRMIQHLAEKTTGYLSLVLQAAYRLNEKHGRIVTEDEVEGD